MPPEPPRERSDSDDDALEQMADLAAHIPAGYQLLTSLDTNLQTSGISSSSESDFSSDDETDMTGAASGRIRTTVSMTIPWPEDTQESLGSDTCRQQVSPTSDANIAQLQYTSNSSPAGQNDVSVDDNNPVYGVDRALTDAVGADNATGDVTAAGVSGLTDRAPTDAAGGRSLSPTRAEAVRRAMSAVALPDSAIPAWARQLTDDQWKGTVASLLAKTNTK